MKADVRAYTPTDWPRLAEFIHDYWSPTHPILSQRLFNWQYHGYLNGNSSPDRPPALVLWEGDRLIGFLGLIHGEYQLNRPDGRLAPGVALAMWMIHPELRGAGLGPRLLAEVEARSDVVVCLGVNREAGACYQRRGYRQIEALDRWVAPLEADGYAALCKATVELADLRAWASALREATPAPPVELSADVLADAWRRTTWNGGTWRVQGLHRSAHFWQTRYLESVGYHYLAWGVPIAGPLVIGRIEAVAGQPLRVLRLVELLPRDPSAWHGPADPALAELVAGVSAWAAEQNCVAVDYQAGGGALRATLEQTALRCQARPIECDPATSLAPVFQPLNFDKPAINVYYRAPADVADERWYFPKSDGDMDRPHAMP